MTEAQCATETRSLARSYRPTPPEQKVLATHRARRKAAPPSPRMTVSRRDGATRIGMDHPKPAVAEVLLMEALGTLDRDFLTGS